ncbi:MAG: diacylglycerol kinase family lipid kinase [Gammaproteobacteria bacterium]|nr:diacylglycerol kinase family lipid kinase [Gammaproteobacteria bacterium]NNL00012.1 diacylglycerol kinase family lipid kinase [Xanthomonadales bacterium]
MKLLIIFNPKAAYGRSVKKLEHIKSRFAGLGIDAKFLPTGHPGHGKELVAGMDLAAFDGLVAAGGDGTLFEVLNGLYSHPKADRIPVGLIPIGTGNAFARELDLEPDAWQEAVDLLHRGQTRLIDVVEVKAADLGFYYLNTLHMGFSVTAGLVAQKLKFFGRAAYTMATLWQVLNKRSYPLVMEIDGAVVRSDNVFVTISNSRYTGTHFLIAPGASIDDGLLDVTLLQDLSRRRLLRLFPTIYSGRHVGFEEVSVQQAKHIRILSPPGMLLGPDGEFAGKSPVDISCLQRDLAIFC